MSFGFIENKGQWTYNAQYKAELPGAILYINSGEVLFDTWDVKMQGDYFHAAKFGESLSGFPTQQSRHSYKQLFVGTSSSSTFLPSNPSDEHYNFFLGNDSARWVSGLKKFQFLSNQNIYPGIHMVYVFSQNQLKYNFHVSAGQDASKIRWTYEGIDKVLIRNEELILQTSLGDVRERKPIAWQFVDGNKINIPVEFKKSGKEISFHFPKGYNKSVELIIDPLMIFSTYVGSVADSWGYTATPGHDGSGYAGGISFGANYPTTIGAYQTAWGAGGVDAVISKFSPNGNNLLYSTFLGGNAPDMPHSIIEAVNGELYILGSTGSLNFPVSANAYDNTFNGGPNTTFFNGLMTFGNGSDIFISRLSANGNNLLSSTFLGGSGLDGLNMATQLAVNYADQFRGEIIIDDLNNVYISSVSNSTNYPVLSAFQSVFGGGASDAVFSKLSPDLQQLQASSYFGGNGADAGYSIQRAKSGLIYFTGGTNSVNLTTTPGVIRPTFGGNVDGFLVRLNQAGTTLQASTFIGNANYNQSYFVQLDTSDNVFVMGQTMGGYPIQAAPGKPVYSVANSGHFIHKLNPTLTATMMSTCFGSGPNTINLAPTAFLLHDCNQIYIAGWGGSVNSNNGGIAGSTIGLPTTPGAYKPTTNGDDFYLAVFDEDAESLLYATFMGGTNSADHVDGGTSRFDKRGVVYQAMCASCGGMDDLATTPGAYSSTNNSSNCNIAIVKFDVAVLNAYLNVANTTVCEDVNVTFSNQSNGGVSYTWHYGDGASSNTFNGNHVYSNPGTYTVMLIATDPQNCVLNDTAFTSITVLPKPIAQITQIAPICPESSVQLTASGGVTYQWLAAPGMPSGQLTSATPTVTPPQTTTYQVIASNNCGSDTAFIQVPVINFSIQISNTDTICLGQSTQLQSSGGSQYLWSPTTGLSNAQVANPTATPLATTTYTVTVTNPDGCVLDDEVYIQVDEYIKIDAGPDTLICIGDQVQLNVVNATHYVWQPATYLNNAFISNPIATPLQTQTYIIKGRNACGETLDTLTVHVKTIEPISGPDTLVCPGTEIQLYSSGGVEYLWFPKEMVSDFHIQNPTAVIPHNVTFQVVIKDSIGCMITDTVIVHTYEVKNMSAGPDRYLEFGESTTLLGDGPEGQYQWTPPMGLSCTGCLRPIANPRVTTTYGLTFTDSNGCYFIDSVTVYVLGNIYVPNTFTVDNNGLNELFHAYGIDIEEFDMVIFNRWGEIIYKTDSIDKGWDGQCGNKPCKQDTYVYRIIYKEKEGREGELIGHINLLR